MHIHFRKDLSTSYSDLILHQQCSVNHLQKKKGTSDGNKSTQNVSDNVTVTFICAYELVLVCEALCLCMAFSKTLFSNMKRQTLESSAKIVRVLLMRTVSNTLPVTSY